MENPFKVLELSEDGGGRLETETDGFPGMDLSASTRAVIEKRRAEMKLAAVPKKKNWYELDRYLAYRDLLFLAGFGLVIAGVAWWSGAGAMVLAGVGLMLAGWLMSR